jgi:hypothetical protein
MTKRIIALSTLLALGACATAVEPPPPPPAAIVSFAPASACTSAPAVAAAVSLTPEEPTGRLEKIVALDAAAPCLSPAGGGAAPYAVFALPTAGKVASISAGAVLEARRMVAPAVYTAGADGSLIRSFEAGDLRHRGRTYAVVFTPKADEKFVVVAAEPASMGKAFSLLSVDPATAAVPKAITDPARIAEYRAGYTRPYSYEGEVFARVYFADPAPK